MFVVDLEAWRQLFRSLSPPTCLHAVFILLTAVRLMHCLLSYYCKLMWKWNFFVLFLSTFCFSGCGWRETSSSLFSRLIRNDIIWIMSFALSGLVTAEWLAGVHAALLARALKMRNIIMIHNKPCVTANNNLQCCRATQRQFLSFKGIFVKSLHSNIFTPLSQY